MPASANAFTNSSIEPALGSLLPVSHKETAASEHPRRLERTACFGHVRVRSPLSCSANGGACSGGSASGKLEARFWLNAIEALRWTSVVVIEDPLSKVRAAAND